VAHEKASGTAYLALALPLALALGLVSDVRMFAISTSSSFPGAGPLGNVESDRDRRTSQFVHERTVASRELSAYRERDPEEPNRMLIDAQLLMVEHAGWYRPLLPTGCVGASASVSASAS